MNKALKVILIIIAVLVVAFLAIYAYHGGFYKVEVTEQEMGPYKVVYQEHIGPYQETGPIMDEVYESLLADGIKTTRGIGIYYDDPAKIDADKLKSHVGSIVEEEDYEALAELGDKYSVREVEKDVYVTADFPFKNTLSIVVSMFKVYPKMGEYMIEKGYTSEFMIEIYDVPNGKTLFLADIMEQ